jgi:hypothetical protein
MSRILATLLVVVLLVASVPSAAHAGGHGPGRGLVGLAAFALVAPFIIAAEVLSHTVPRVVVAAGARLLSAGLTLTAGSP